MVAPLPPELLKVSAVIGLEAALLLAAELGGTKVYVARNPGPDSLLARAIGLEAARRLGAEHGTEYLDVPGAKQHLVAWLDARGEPIQGIARRLKMHERSVRRILHRRPGDDRQGSLFPAD